MSRLEHLVNERAQELADALWPILRAVVRLPGGRRLLLPVVVDLVRALQEHADSSEFATTSDRPGRLVSVKGYLDATAAAAAVGCSPEYVRRLCRTGLVAHQRTGRRGYLVDIEDLRRHFRRKVA